MPGTFIDVTVDPAAAGDAALARTLSEVCPVDIFAVGEAGAVVIVESNLDECVLCELCINASPPGTITVHKLYSGESLPARPRAG